MSIVTLTTDFGLHDGYVGTMKGVILSIAPRVTLVDISHDIAPQNTHEAAFVIYSAYRHFPRDTVHLVVVDPGVGTGRRPMALSTPRGLFVAPDNGVLGYVLGCEESWSAIQLTEPRYWLPQVSRTFHGRDIFAPAAAHLALGVPFEKLGIRLAEPIAHEIPAVEPLGPGRLRATVLHIDRFGNVVTNLPADMSVAGASILDQGPRLRAHVAGHTLVGLRAAYGDAPAGENLLLVGSAGLIEIARCEGNVAQALDIHAGDTITFEVIPDLAGARGADVESEPARER